MKSTLLYLFVVAILMLGGCQGSTQDSQQVYQKRAEVISVSNEPASYRSFALVSNGNIHVGGKLTTDGPLADIHANGTVQARALSLNVSGKITAQNNTSGLAIRSFDYTSNVDNQSFVEVRALKVSEYLNTSMLNEYYLLGADGVATHRVKDSPDLALDSLSSNFIFNGNTWEISGDMLELAIPVVVETDLQITTNSLFIAGTLMVQGNLLASGELNINTGTPFDKALIVDRNIEVDKLVAIGRVHGSGTFTSHGEVNILGNAEIDGDVTLYGDARINFLDNVYKAAISEAQNEILSDPYAAVDAYTEPTLMLVHSQLFSDAQGNNSVVLFTFVEGNYILNENTLFQLIETGQVDDFKFRSYLYGATMDYAAQLQKFSGLSPYYANKLALINKLKSQGNAQVKLTESLDIAPSNLYHSFEDSAGNKLGTYLIYSMGSAFDENSPVMLTADQRNQAIYNIVHKDEIEAQQELEAEQALTNQKASLLMDTTVDDYTKQIILTQIEEKQALALSTDKVAAKIEETQQHIDEWVGYKAIEGGNEEIEVADVVVDQATAARGWFRRIRRAVRRVFRPVCSILSSPVRKISGVSGSPTLGLWSYYYDWWSRNIALGNNGNYCVPISTAMILNYHYIRKHKASAYSTNRNAWERTNAASPGANQLVQELAKVMLTDKVQDGTFLYPYSVYYPYQDRRGVGQLSRGIFAKYGLGMWSGTYPNIATYQKNSFFSSVRWYISQNQPIMYWSHGLGGTVSVLFGFSKQDVVHHAMPVIGYKYETFRNVCRLMGYRERKWFMVDSTWGKRKLGLSMVSPREYLRFDNYFTNDSSLTFFYVW